ncbi:hypothetical protein C9J44_04600 [Photobacterium sp. GB-27]|nr:hypothetical protein C9J40_10855 [Photobacterium sp. GB-72]PSV37671.1 hypothetical protein C9J38_10305 [Photobacterium sp. GB-210]PSV38315.1 hypothetical protein C9J44_04600 [Photobacterium sp. GB-27]PSV44986.1 hypothetical protein C9J46_07900 [Photobacterium sp. GB-36]PSV52147.1 hypothetical protein C9J45_12085 [Photobacterium sp. GB-1]PSV55923.1 hypothetical protein C9J43_13510 [Photobacterium sp. GB-3]PSW74091.1 hypothetical protein C9J41_07945 [Photobacterium sp. GB-50]
MQGFTKNGSEKFIKSITLIVNQASFIFIYRHKYTFIYIYRLVFENLLPIMLKTGASDNAPVFLCLLTRRKCLPASNDFVEQHSIR